MKLESINQPLLAYTGNILQHTVPLKGSLAEYRGVTLPSFGLILWYAMDHVA